MSKPFDATLKRLVTLGPKSWLTLLGIDAKFVKICNVDLSTVTSSADSVLFIEDEQKEIVHIELQSGPPTQFVGERCALYSLLGRKSLKAFRVPVRSVLVLLSPRAAGRAMSGVMRQRRRDGSVYHEFHYEVVRVWELPPERFLECEGIGVLPLAFISKIERRKLPELVRRVETRLKNEATPRRTVGEIWTSIKLLLGLRYRGAFVSKLLRGATAMKESSTYREIVKEGEVKGEKKGLRKGIAIGKTNALRSTLVQLGTMRFGRPTQKTLAAVKRIGSVQRLDKLVARTLTASSWNQLIRK